MNFWEALVLAIVEGITEFLPISSTGHMIIASAVMGLESNELVKMFTVNIQFGAILSVVVLYFKRFFQSFEFYAKLLVAFLPAAVIGFLLGDFIDSLLENVWVVSIMLILGGVLLLFVDKWFQHQEDEYTSSNYFKLIKVGFFQCLALVPGVSRSAATIVGGMSQGWSRKSAAEFSFFLAVPTMFAASAYKLLKTYKQIQWEDILILAFGNAIAFIVAMLAIRFFIGFLTKHGFKIFGWYRIAVGTLLLGLLLSGFSLSIV